ncbi:MAG: pyridine nucleotide-disulfide oxidoreductase [Nitriliruptorales bacterium]|nr:pyridine nucleotide-disulfide oxidoreductase [Nitriliruptorales bacterium]
MDTTTVVIGAGHAGLAMSRRLTERSIDHVVLERGEVANSWRTERWDSLRLLTPNWQSRLPGMGYSGDDPDGYMRMPEVIDFIAGYACAIAAPVQTGTTVTRVTRTATGYEVTTDRGIWSCATVVVASGGSNVADVPAVAAGVPTSVTMHTPMTYRSPDQLDQRGVLVVGASATGVQLADEIRRSGRAVTIAVGEHVRLPRLYRGRDIFWWMDAEGIFDERYDEVDDLVRARHLPSPQLIGTSQRRSIDLNGLAAAGIQIVGRLGRISDGVAQFSGSLANLCTLADLKMNRLLTRLDDWATETHLDVERPYRPEPTSVPSRPILDMDLRKRDVGTVIWATGYRPDHSWLDVPVFDHKGRIRHDGGVVRDAPGMYLLGANVLRRRRSSYIHGAEQDTAELGAHLHRYLDSRARSPRPHLARPSVSA